ncbi:thiol-activated cytolysin family protein [Pedobacter sp. PAMC26386]|nr:thiol-activated cytolysin family protein [Pedobacter sp. PAMC26386]
MQKTIFKFILLGYVLLFFACKKQENIPSSPSNQEKPLLSSILKDLRIEPIAPIIIQGGTDNIKHFLDKQKQNSLVFLRDSTWSSGGYSKIYQTDEVVVTPDNESYVYPGSIIKSASVTSGNFAPLKGYTKLPIRITASFPSDKSIGVIDVPSLSRTRVFLRNALMDPSFSGKQLESFTYSSNFFRSYEESKMAFGYNMNEKKMFSSVNSSFNSENSRTSYQTGLIMTYLVKNFTLSTPNPEVGELLDLKTLPAGTMEGVSPVYMDAVTYGRFGFLMIETNMNSELAKTAFEKVIKKIFRRSTETFSLEEQSLFNSCRITVYLLGSSGGSVTQLLNNPGSYDGLSNFINDSLGEFTANDPGVPIQFTLKYLLNNESYKPVFKVNYPN